MSVKTALVVVLSEVRSDPRVRHQITWLTQAGWTVDTVGLGTHPTDEVRQHFELQAQKSWVRSRIGAVIAYRLLPKRTMFRRLALDRFPEEVKGLLRAGSYGLLVLEDFDFLPLILDPQALHSSQGSATHVHLDMHEYRGAPRVATPWNRLTRRYRAWQRELIGHPRITSRTTVASRIAELYASEFDIEMPSIVRNAPPFEPLVPSPVQQDRISMVFHGLASWQRGFEQILEAMRLLDSRFVMTFMLTGNPNNIDRLRRAAADLGERVRIVPPVPMTEISREINQYDLEIMFYPPVEPNVEFALPNKFFEAIQGRLGVVIGESPMMAELVVEYGLGPIVSGWTGKDLADALAPLTASDVDQYKRAADLAAQSLNAEHEGRVFVEAITRRAEFR